MCITRTSSPDWRSCFSASERSTAVAASSCACATSAARSRTSRSRRAVLERWAAWILMAASDISSRLAARRHLLKGYHSYRNHRCLNASMAGRHTALVIIEVRMNVTTSCESSSSGMPVSSICARAAMGSAPAATSTATAADMASATASALFSGAEKSMHSVTSSTAMMLKKICTSCALEKWRWSLMKTANSVCSSRSLPVTFRWRLMLRPFLASVQPCLASDSPAFLPDPSRPRLRALALLHLASCASLAALRVSNASVTCSCCLRRTALVERQSKTHAIMSPTALAKAREKTRS
mmetsp:Transcript_25079/g.63646  ORF Transcript_25079/g.63646 Transcript_25079/m.63646 type:complete len:296 (-) Transcript_25079:1230-2117(-)